MRCSFLILRVREVLRNSIFLYLDCSIVVRQRYAEFSVVSRNEGRKEGWHFIAGKGQIGTTLPLLLCTLPVK